MSGLRSIEMQVALPRTQTAGKIQEQMQQRSAVTQDQLAQAKEEKDVKQKNSVTESEETAKNNLDNDVESSGNQSIFSERNHDVKAESKQFEETVLHPYKGQYFDASW